MAEKTCGKCRWYYAHTDLISVPHGAGLNRGHCCLPNYQDDRERRFGTEACGGFEPYAPLVLLDALKEMVPACAAAIRILISNGLGDDFIEEATRVGVKDGFGVRAKKAIAEYEGGA